MNRPKQIALVVVTLAGVAGSPVAATGQPAAVREPASRTDLREGLEFRAVSWVTERAVMNSNGEEVAGVADLILDRGSGRIDYAVLSTGTILGMGGRRVAVSYDALRWDAGGEHFLLPLTPEQLKQFPEFSEHEWKGVTDPGADAKSLRQRLMTDAAAGSIDPYAPSLEGASDARVKGEITAVERRGYGEFGEHVVVVVQTEDGGTRRVALGPTWYVNSGVHAPMRGDSVVIEAVAAARDPERMLVARTVRIGGKDELVLRTREGTPGWVAKTETAESRSYAARRYVLLSSLDGADVTCRGEACGEVDDLIVERKSGVLAFLTIDPDEKFLGIGDLKRLVPWTVASVTSEGAVRIDASKGMVLASPEAPADAATMHSGGLVSIVYRSYEVDVPSFEARRAKDAGEAVVPPGMKEAWSREGTICRGIKKDSLKTMSGEGMSVREVRLGDGVPSASAATFKSDGEDVLVLLGPSWYMQNQKLPCADRERVRVEAYRTTIGGKDYWLAKSIECGGSRVVLIDGDGAPTWDRK